MWIWTFFLWLRTNWHVADEFLGEFVYTRGLGAVGCTWNKQLHGEILITALCTICTCPSFFILSFTQARKYFHRSLFIATNVAYLLDCFIVLHKMLIRTHNSRYNDFLSVRNGRICIWKKWYGVCLFFRGHISCCAPGVKQNLFLEKFPLSHRHVITWEYCVALLHPFNYSHAYAA